MQRAPHQIQLPHRCSSWLQEAARSLLLVLSVCGCSFGAQEDSAEQNVCQVNADCATQHCEAGRCVADVEAALPITLVVTPKRTPSGSQVQPIVSESILT